jgi:hypothetical protein
MVRPSAALGDGQPRSYRRGQAPEVGYTSRKAKWVSLVGTASRVRMSVRGTHPLQMRRLSRDHERGVRRARGAWTGMPSDVSWLALGMPVHPRTDIRTREASRRRVSLRIAADSVRVANTNLEHATRGELDRSNPAPARCWRHDAAGTVSPGTNRSDTATGSLVPLGALRRAACGGVHKRNQIIAAAANCTPARAGA